MIWTIAKLYAIGVVAGGVVVFIDWCKLRGWPELDDE